MRATQWAVLSCVLFLACAGVQTVSTSSERGPVLFTVTDPKHPGASLDLLGTVHLQDPNFLLDKAVEQAIDAAEEVYVEIDLKPGDEQALQQLMLKRGTLPEGQTIQDVVSVETYRAIQKTAEELHVSLAQLERFRPWLLQLTFTILRMQKANQGLRADLGIDKRVLTASHAAGKRVTSLESPEFQADLFSSGDAATQAASLASSLKMLGKVEEVSKAMFVAYAEGDLVELNRLLGASKTETPPAEFRRFWVDRNKAMFDKLKGHFAAPRRGLVAVGAGHLLGEEGLVRLFEKAGYKVERVRAMGPGAPYVVPWVVAREAEADCLIEFPAAPKRTEADLRNGGKNVTLRWQGRTIDLSLEITQLPGLGASMQRDRAGVIDTILKSVLKSLIEFEGRTIEKTEGVVAGYKATRALIRDANFILEIVFINQGDRLFSLKSITATEPTASEEGRRFFESFRLSSPEVHSQ